MNTSQKKPLLYIGLIAFLAIAVVGILYDFISKSEGIVAIISVVVAFLILAAVLVIDAISRKREAKNGGEEDPYDAAEPSVDSRFLRHTEESSEDNDFVWRPNNTARSGFAGFGRRGADAAGEEPVEESVQNTWDQPVTRPADSSFGFEQTADETHSAFAPRMETEGVDSFETDMDDLPEDIDDIADDGIYELPSEPVTVQPAESAPAVQPTAQPEPYEDDMFKPVLRLTGTEPQPEPQPAAPAEEPKPAVQQMPEPQPAQPEHTPAAPAQPAAEPVPVQAEQTAPKPTAAERRAAAAVPAASTVSTAVGGQSLESFFEEMSDEDILYRDCVEVWAADAKPSALRLIKYVEGIEDKQTAALIGREVEYLNAMLDRINCFTQLEYIDELLEYRKHNYSTLVKDCLKRFSPFFMEKRLGLLWKGLDIDVMTDRRWFIFALTQVIFNAVEFTPNGGKIAISAKRHDNYIDLTVEDSGKGISPDELPFIFMAGYMGDDAPNENGGRTGMGLFIAQSVMRKMGGEMLAESTPGKGTRITLRMPIIEPNA